MSLFERLHSLRLRTKFVLAVSAMLIASMVVTSGYMIQRQADGFRRELVTNGETMIHILAVNAVSGVIFESEYELDELIAVLSNFEAFVHIAVYNADGTVLASLGEWDQLDIASRTLVVSEASPFDSGHYYTVLHDGTEHIELSEPVVIRKESLSRETLGITSGYSSSAGQSVTTEVIGSVRLVLSLKSVNEAIASARNTAILTTLLVVVLAILLLNLLVRVITRPVSMLVAITDQVAHGDLSQTVNINQKDEIGHLANTFNKMIGSLRQSRDEIEEYNRNLEEKIIDRTIALEEAQSQLIQSEKMGAIGQLAAGVAHELNNPLGGILGYAQFALEKMSKVTEERGANKEIEGYVRYLTYIETQARRCKAIVQNLLRFSRSSHAAEVDDVDANDVIEDTVTFMEHQLHMNQITLKRDLAPKLPTIQANAGQLQQVLTNLIINAMHASASETEITVSSSYSPAVGEFGGTVELKVSDQGHGIPPETLKKIFEPFFTTKEVGKGTGLGLSLSYGIIADHGGEIRVDSKVGEGSTFSVILPVQKAGVDADKTTGKMFSS